mgnify:CR=1 FL=1
MLIVLCLDRLSRLCSNMAFGIVSPFRGLPAADAQRANCEAPERAGADRRQHPCKGTRWQQRYVATIVSNSVFTIASIHVNIHNHNFDCRGYQDEL